MHLCWDGQFYLEELVKQKGEPVGEHLLRHRLRPGGGKRGETVSAKPGRDGPAWRRRVEEKTVHA